MSTAFFLKRIWLFLLMPIAGHLNGKLPPALVDPPKVSIVQSDKLGNYFALNNEGLLLKFDRNGRINYTYDNRISGRIWSFDATDPMKIIVFFRESQQLVLLDNTLSEMSTIYLNQLHGRYFSSVSRTNDGSLALFDINNEVLLKTDDKLFIEGESFPLFQEGFPGFRPVEMMANTHNIILNDPKKGLILMDNYCNFRQFIQITNSTLVRIDDHAMVYLADDKLFWFDLDFYFEHILPWPKNGSIPAYFGLDKDEVIVFDLKKND